MKDIVEFIVKQFVSNPDAVVVEEQMQDGYVNVTLKVAPEDMGLVIGKSGQTIKGIRRLLTIKAIAENARVNLELIDSGAPRNETEQSSDEPTTEQPESENGEPKTENKEETPQEQEEAKEE